MAKFKNLEAEMVRNGLNCENIAEKLDITPQTARRKLNGDIGITIAEAKAIKSLFQADFTIENIYPLLLWIFKNANKYYDEQLISMFKYFTEPDNIQNYKSNQKVFLRNKWYPENFENKEEVSNYTLSYRIICKILHTKNYYMGRYSNYIWGIKDVCTIANNLGFHVDTDSIPQEYKYGEKYSVYLKDGKIFMDYRCYKNGNMHIKFNKEFMKAFNVEASRLLGWIRNPEDIKKEFPEELAKGAEKYFKQNYTCIGSNILLLTTKKESA